MAKQAINIRLFSLEQIPHPGANLQKVNARPWEQVQLRMPDKRRGGGGCWATMELIETTAGFNPTAFKLLYFCMFYF
jgi:hypothetical protein